MKITHNKVGTNLNVRDTGKAEKSDKTKAASGLDANDAKAGAVDALGDLGATKVNLSSRAQDIKNARELAGASADINEEKVNRLQKLIDEGNYKTDAKEIASNMVDEHLMWE